jgi:hypothetical protein
MSDRQVIRARRRRVEKSMAATRSIARPATPSQPTSAPVAVPAPTRSPPAPTRSPLASGSVGAHLARGAVGLLAAVLAIALVPVVGAVSLLLLLGTALAWRGCPTCWTVGLLGTLADRRAGRECSRC